MHDDTEGSIAELQLRLVVYCIDCIVLYCTAIVVLIRDRRQ